MPLTSQPSLPPQEMSAFSLNPFFDDNALYDPLSPFRGRLFSPYTELDVREVQRLRRELGMVGGITHRRDIFEVDMDVQGYKPEDLNISVEQNIMTISGSHEEKNEDGTHYQAHSFSRRFLLPQNIEMDKMKSYLTKDGRIECLRVEAPLKKPADEDKEKAKGIPLTINYKWTPIDSDLCHKLIKKSSTIEEPYSTD